MKSGLKPALRQEFDREAHRLTRTTERYDLMESVMRLRVLTEIAEALSTEALLDLAATVGVGGKP